MRLMFGGHYERFVVDDLQRDWRTEPKSEEMMAMEAELLALREAVVTSREWGATCKAHRRRLSALKKKSPDAIERSLFALVMQSIENHILTSMRRFLSDEGWRELTLIFDGLHFAARPGERVDLEAMRHHVKRETGFDVRIVIKPMCDTPKGQWPQLSLARPF